MNIGVIGAGAFGTALAQALSYNNQFTIDLCSDLESVAVSINSIRINLQFLPGFSVFSNIKGRFGIQHTIKNELIFIVVPAQVVRSVCKELKERGLSPNTPIILCSKGIEQKTGLFMSEVAASEISNPLYVLSGPSFAHELVRGLPTQVILAGHNAELIAQKISTNTFIACPTQDIIGTQISGSLKNILAVGTGIVLSFGENIRALFITKAMEEMVLFTKALKGDPNTIYGLAGLGDILLTCMSSKSRNTDFGIKIAKGEIQLPIKEENIKSMPLTEGAITAAILPKLEARSGIKLPIFSAIYELIYGNLQLHKFIERIIRC